MSEARLRRGAPVVVIHGRWAGVHGVLEDEVTDPDRRVPVRVAYESGYRGLCWPRGYELASDERNPLEGAT